jgi:RNA polymerase sigma factor (sigma-70 family)
MSSADDMVERLYRAESRALETFARRRLGAAEAGDLVQEAFLNFLLRRRDSAEVERPRSYLYRIAANLIVDRMRRRGRSSKAFAEEVDLENEAASPINHRIAADAMMQASFIQIYLDELPETCRNVYLLHQVKGFTCREISENLDISLRTVNRMMNRAIEGLGVEGDGA